jgi:hypothetical protein
LALGPSQIIGALPECVAADVRRLILFPLQTFKARINLISAIEVVVKG